MTEILSQAVAEELAAEVEEDPEFLVRGFERDEVVLCRARVEVESGNARVEGQIVDNGLADGNVVINEGLAFVLALSAHNGDASESVRHGPDHLALAIRVHLDLGLFQRDKLRVNRYDSFGARFLGLFVQHPVRLVLRVWRGQVLVEDGCIHLCLPVRIALVVRRLHLEQDHGGHLPCRVEGQRFRRRNRPHREVVEQIPLAFVRRGWLCVCDCA
jgi:hypothetical protein